MSRTSRRRRQTGFTLMEVLLVLAILVILGSLAAMSFRGVMEGADRDSAKSQIGLFKGPIEMYYMHLRQYPTDLEALRSPPSDLANPAKWQGPYMDVIPKDPWDRPYKLVVPGTNNPNGFDVFSAGKDGQDGTDDDIGNWEVVTQ